MSNNPLPSKIKKLENLNGRLKQLLDAAQHVVNIRVKEDVKEFVDETKNLKQALYKLEYEKQVLQNDLNQYFISSEGNSDFNRFLGIQCLSDLEKDNVQMTRQLRDLIQCNEKKCIEVINLKNICDELQDILDRLQNRKQKLLQKIRKIMNPGVELNAY